MISLRYFIGSMHESKGFQLLSGIRITWEYNIFWPFFAFIMYLALSISLICIFNMKMLQYFRDRQLRKKIQVKLQLKPPNEFLHQNSKPIEFLPELPHMHARKLSDLNARSKTTAHLLKFNTVKHNLPIFSGVQMIVFTIIPGRQTGPQMKNF